MALAPRSLRSLFQLFHGDVAGALQFLLVGAGTAADQVADAGEQVLEDVGAEDRLAGDDAAVAGDALAFDAGGGGHLHDVLRRVVGEFQGF